MHVFQESSLIDAIKAITQDSYALEISTDGDSELPFDILAGVLLVQGDTAPFFFIDVVDSKRNCAFMIAYWKFADDIALVVIH